jgi:hypothetical protein
MVSLVQSVRGRWPAAVLFALVLASLWHASAGAQSGITITFPSRLAAGPDFATDVLKDPWDFSSIADLGVYPGETVGWQNNAKVIDPAGHPGWAGGIAATADAQVGLLSTGFFTTINPGKEGVNYPIDTSRYQKVSFRLSSNIAGEQPQLYWFHTTWQHPSDAAAPPDLDRNSGVAAAFAFPLTNGGTQTFVADLTKNNQSTGSAGYQWTASPVLGLRLDPNHTNASIGRQFLFDWVRLTYNDNVAGAALQTISWSGGSGNATVDIMDAAGTTVILNVVTNTSATSVGNWNYGVLPPGSYNLRVTRGGVSGLKAFTINNPPSVQVIDPSRTTGRDYATQVLQNAWDMDSAADIVQLPSQNLTGINFNAPGYPQTLTATNTNNDPNVTLLHSNNNQGGTRAIDTSKYKYFTYRLQVDGPFDLAFGSVARVFWASADFMNGGTATTTKDILVYEGMNSYTVDLSKLSAAAGGGLEPSGSQEPWTTNPKKNLRVDPHEFGSAPGDPMPIRPFHLDDVKLTADPVSFGSYTIRFATADADGDPVRVSLFYDTDRNPAGGLTAITGASNVTGGSFVWNTGAIPAGAYFIYAQASDGTETRGSYSDAPLVVSTPCGFSISPASNTVPNGGGAGSVAVTTGASCDWTASSNASFVTITSATVQTGPGAITYVVAANPARTQRTGTLTVAGQTFTVVQAPARAPFDWNGDGVADRTVFRPSNGSWFTLFGATTQWGEPGDVPVAGDYDGNGTPDIAVFRPATGDWWIRGLSPFNFGRAGDIPVPGDWDGNGSTDAAIFRTSHGEGATWFIRTATPFALNWGLRGDVPVPGDYDGDGRLDPAIYRPRTGQWFINFSLNNYVNNTNISWGAAGDVPVPGDYDGDRRTDVAVFRPSTGQWYIAFAGSNFQTFVVRTWGRAGDVPLALDIDGDRVDELTVYRPVDGMWWTYDVITGAVVSQQWGVPGDLPIGARPRVPGERPLDFDGDATADASVFRPSNGTWYMHLSVGGASAPQWGLNGDRLVPGDYDGDRRADAAVFRPSTGEWFLLLSSANNASFRKIPWGGSGDVPVPGDYDGDGLTDLAIFRPSDGNWWVLTSSSNFTRYSTTQFGLRGDVPVPADYDGDGRIDLAVFRPAGGTWFIRTSSGLYGGVFTRQFGLSTDVPVPADYDGDGRADIAIYRPSNGFWVGADIATAKTPVNEPWGAAAGDVPTPGDFDGDGIGDLAVYRPSTGHWFIKKSSGGGQDLKWGEAGDQPVKR